MSVLRSFPSSMVAGLLLTPLLATAAWTVADEEAASRDCHATLRARQAIHQDTVLAPLALGVSIRAGNATVWGAVPDDAAARRAVECVRQVPGVLRVRGELQVLPPTDPLAEFLSRPPAPNPVLPPILPEALKAPAQLTSRWVDGAAELFIAPPAAKPDGAVALLPPVTVSAPPAARDAMATAGPEVLTAAVERLRGSDPRFRGVHVQVIGGVVRLQGMVPRAEDGMELANKIARLPGVERVSLREVRSSLDR